MGFFIAGLALTIGWANWPTFVELDRRWTTEPLYSHGYLIPIVALVILWTRRAMFRTAEMQASAWAYLHLLKCYMGGGLSTCRQIVCPADL